MEMSALWNVSLKLNYFKNIRITQILMLLNDTRASQVKDEVRFIETSL